MAHAAVSSVGARHLFRNLHNAAALRTNPLVGHFFVPGIGSAGLADAAVLARIREAIEGIARSLAFPSNGAAPDRAQRLRELAIRCLLHRESHKKVAADLGISERTLFRDLDEVKDVIARSLPPRLSLEAPRVAVPAPSSLRLRHADLLRGIGKFEEALARFDDIARDTTDVLTRVMVWNESARTLIDCGAFDSAQHTLERSCEALAQSTKHSERWLAVRAELDLTTAILLTNRGKLDDALIAGERAVTAARSMAEHHNQRFTGLYVRALSHVSILLRDLGKLAKAEECIARARSALEALADPPYDAHYQFLIASASTRLFALGDINRVGAEVSNAIRLAQQYGMLRDAVNALGFAALLDLMRGRAHAARETSRRALLTARSVCGPTEFRFFCCTAAAVETAAGNPGIALAVISEARARIGREGYTRLPLQAAEAAALVAAGYYDSAIEAADYALAGKAQGADIKLYLGNIYLAKVEALLKKGDAAAAREALASAIPLLESTGKPLALARAYELSEKLGGNRVHGKAARDLMALLRPAAS
jgi:tetratricopeptide (TPR) repeat protein